VAGIAEERPGERIMDSAGADIDASELLALHDEELVDEAYRRLLGREPDPEGRERYLNALRTAAMTKLEVIGALRYSPEGRARKVPVAHLRGRLVVARLCRVPVLGYLLELILAVLRLPRFFRRSMAFQSALTFQIRRSSATVELLTTELGTQLPKIGELLAGLPTRRDVDQLVGVLERKADLEAVGALAERVEAVRTGLKALEVDLCGHRDRLDVMAAELGGDVRTESLTDRLYVEFEETFRGSRAEIRRRLEAHIDGIAAAMERSGGRFVLDLGCGRGEWLELLKSRGITAQGIDASPAMVATCQSLGLVATEGDALNHLRRQPDACCAAVTAFHLFEHLPFPILLGMIEEMVRVVLPGGVVLIETPNPENLIVGACTFYTDPGHRRPLVPETMRFLLERAGLVNVEVRRLNRYDELHPVHSDDPVISRWLYGEMDYALVGTRP